MKSITVCITSFNRFNLLKQTLDSFIKLNNYPVDKIIVAEDSCNHDMKLKILNEYANKIELVFNESRLGQIKSIDNAYSKITSEYIFHCEDDYLFTGNSNFMQDSLNILEENKSVHQVWIKPENQCADFIEKAVHFTSTGVAYRLLKLPHCGDWCGFSFNPGLRRREDYINMFPYGYAEFMDPGEKGVYSEHKCNHHAMKNGYRAAFLVNSAAINMGESVSTYDKDGWQF